MKSLTFLILSGLLCTVGLSVEMVNQHLNTITRKEYVKVLGSEYYFMDEIRLLVNGELAAIGGCSKDVMLGLIRKNKMNGTHWLM